MVPLFLWLVLSNLLLCFLSFDLRDSLQRVNSVGRLALYSCYPSVV